MVPAQIAAVHIREASFASWANLQGEAHIERADAFDIAALLDHREQDVVAFVQQGETCLGLFRVAIRQIARFAFVLLGGVSVVSCELARAGTPAQRIARRSDE